MATKAQEELFEFLELLMGTEGVSAEDMPKGRFFSEEELEEFRRGSKEGMARTRREAARAGRASGLREGRRRGYERGNVEGVRAGYKEGRRVSREKRAKAKEAMEAGRKMRFGGKVGGTAARLGSKFLIGGGLLGTGLMALDLLSMLKEGAQDDTYKQLRAGSGGELQSSLAAVTAPREMDRLRASQGFRRRAEMNRTVNPRVSSDLRALLEDRQIRELAGAGQSIKPSIREAYARMGLFA